MFVGPLFFFLPSPFFHFPSHYGKKAARGMPNNFFAELKRRNVLKVALTYAVVAWLLIQLVLLPALQLPSWAIKTLVVLLIIGFVTIVFISWFFEATPEGMKRTVDISPTEVLPTWSRKKFTIFIVATALLATGLLVFELLER
jgi:adenylate cyclase